MKIRLLALSLAISASSLHAAIELPALFSDGMVLQRNIKVPVWGWAEPGDEIQVDFGLQCKTATTGSNGKWMLYLDPLTASAVGAKMHIRTDSEEKVVSNILVGEVWLCSGQSNMDRTLGADKQSAKNPKYQPIVDFVRKEIASARDPLLRQITVEKEVSAFEPQERFEGQWIESFPESNILFTATGYFFARELRRELGVPVGLLKSAWGGTRIEPWMPMEAFQNDADLKKYYDDALSSIRKTLATWDEETVMEDYLRRVEKWESTHQGWTWKPKWVRRGKPERPDQSNTVPSTLYNGMVHPLVPYAIKGAVWYQGESNIKHFPEAYSKRFSAMAKGWRTDWGQGDFPIYYAQLANFGKVRSEATDEYPWVTVCNQQRLALSVKNTGMAVLNDIGEAEDIHPRNKIDVGKRLALWALAKTYGQNDLVCSGPLFKSAVLESDKVIVTFDSVGEGLMVGRKHLMEPTVATDEPLKGFQICGSDRVWKWAEARIVDADKIEVSHPEIDAPVEVRYAWAKNPEGANLYNKAGLPTSVFKTALK